MATRRKDECSLDEESDDDEVQSTAVLLGVPDGIIENSEDLKDPLVSKIGGPPAFAKGITPSIESAHCKHCSNPMELAIQIWCPRENSPMDRVLYAWTCSRAGCQRRPGSVRVFRGLSYNAKYAAEMKRAEKQKMQLAHELPAPAMATSNPFSMTSRTSGATPFGIDFFATQSLPPEAEPNEKKGSERGDEVSEVVDALQDISLDPSRWESLPSHPPLYLATVDEVIIATTTTAAMKPISIDATSDMGIGGEGIGSEMYENSLDADPIFERFSMRVANEGEQCIRYDLGGFPLAFQFDDVYRKLFPLPNSVSTAVTGGAFTVVNTPRRQYDVSLVERCSFCGNGRVFECQLMPHLINVLGTSSGDQGTETSKQTFEERQREVERLVKGLRGGVSPEEVTGMEWGTCLIFTCQDDCCMEQNEGGIYTEANSCWREEVVLVQWEL